MQEIKFEQKAVLRNYRSTAQKTRRVINMVRGKKVEEARAILKFAPQEAAEAVLKLLNSAVANALVKADRTGLRISEDSLFISEIFADEGATMKRFRPRARGTAGRILKRTSHITLFVGTFEDVIAAPKDRAAKKDSAKDSTKDVKSNDTAATSEDAKSADAPKDPTKKDSTKAAGKAHKPEGPKEIKATGAKADAKSAVGHRKENMRKKGA